MEDNSNSIYSSVTKLSEKFAHRLNGSQHKNVRRLRRKCYEILLSKSQEEIAPSKACLEGSKDPFCHLLTWEYELITKYNQRKHAEKLHQCAKKLEGFYSCDNETFNGILYLLLQLRKIPQGDDSIMDKNINSICRLQSSIFQPTNYFSSTVLSKFDENTFKLPLAISCSESKYSNESFQLKPQKTKGRRILSSKKNSSSVCVLYKQNTANIFQSSSQKSGIDINERVLSDEGYISPVKVQQTAVESDDIWELASKTQFTDNRTWESFGRAFPAAELPFLSELGVESHLWTNYVVALQNSISLEKPLAKIKIQNQESFAKHVKFMLVGIASRTFLLVNEQFVLNAGISLSNFTPATLNEFVKELIFCGNCYRALNLFVTPNEVTGKYQENGFIFAELCESIKRYLAFYRFVILSLCDGINLLTLHNRIGKLKEQIDTLVSLCKIGPYKKQEEKVPCGVELINYIYKRVLCTTNENVLMILYSVLYPCCQVYFSRFLHQWILEGTLDDPYDEFFVISNFKYITTKGRTFWTRSYITMEENVPEFLSHLKSDIFSCGKAMNLLRFCVPSSPLQLYLMSKKTSLFSCCFTSEQLTNLEQNVARYNLEACAACSPLFSLAEKMCEMCAQNPEFHELVAKKRLATLKRLELEKMKKLEEEMERKREAMALLKEQYDIAVQQKQKRILRDIERDIAFAERDLEIEKMRNQLIQEEAKSLIAYYSELSDISEKRYQEILKHNNHIKTKLPSPKTEDIPAEPPPIKIEEVKIDITPKTSTSSLLSEPLSKSTSADTFNTAMEMSDSECVTAEQLTPGELHSSKSMDILNANLEELQQKDEVNQNFLMAQENFKAALRNRAKVMSLELGIDTKTVVPKPRTKYGLHNDGVLTEAQRNRLRVMSSEFGIEIGDDVFKKDLKQCEKSQMQINKEKMMTSNECFYNKTADTTDNVNFINRNVVEASGEATRKLSLKIEKPVIQEQQATIQEQQTSLDVQKPTPMSIDSTPISEIASTPSSGKFWQFFTQNEAPSTAATNFTDEGFDFKTTDKKQEYVPCFTETTNHTSVISSKSKRVTVEEVENIKTNCLHLFLQQSVAIPLAVQIKLINQELLKFFVNDLQYLKHLISLRDYFFLQDGEFGRNITEGLFEKLYDVNFPVELINCRTLQMLVHKALNSSSKCQENSDCLSFKINNLPKRFDLGDLNVLDCLSLSYKVNWPLNILLPVDTLAKYDEVFKYLLKLHRVSWVQKKIFEELKFLIKQVGRNQMYLLSSPQYRRIHQCRHVMSHFIQTFQNYIVGDVLQSNWEIFNRKLLNVTDLDQLYSVHTTYIKNILFMCLLNSKAAPIRKVLEKIFIVILKFYDYLRSQQWTIQDGHYVHPNFRKLENIFTNFEEFVMYMFKVGRKIVKTGYQPYLVQLLDMLDINGYYDKRNIAVSSC